jgi:hypothetical protein
MKRESLKIYLRAYSILGRRKTTINHAFASAIALNDEYDDRLVIEAIIALGQDPDSDLVCVYCNKHPAETWDHVFGLVRDQQFSGFGHTVGNLLPCCKQCNSSKGNKNWREFVSFIIKEESQRVEKISQLERYFSRYLDNHNLAQDEIERICPDEMRQLREAHDKIIALMEYSDKVAVVLREKIKTHLNVQSQVKSKSV